MLRNHLIISGVVQGVGFRMTAKQRANEVGVYGWVKNLPDGTVEIEVEGSKDKVNEFTEVIRKGPGGFIKVDHVEITTLDDPKGYSSFEVKL
ncbi:acylphosphatase [Aquibacillus halophilus]|uniref:Acylphosphatase n=1 Tax=Aquibacillus halophilus TaxID=930132 RepID=A0A6A8DAZ7_9BACI|nr:acylphosphatase [Aquibacillus halophilus]MRH42480.1 acylphosphatase [Aquibacillus halophilus]